MAANLAPENTVPGPRIVEANTDGAIEGLAVFDADAGGGTLTTTLSVLHGKLTFLVNGGATLGGNGSPSVTLSGTLGEINAALAIPGNLTYRGDPDFFGTDTLTIATNDNGNSGTGGAQSDTDQLAIDIKTLTIGSADDESYAALPGNQRIDAGHGIDTITFGFKLTDATIIHTGNMVIVEGPLGSRTILTGIEVFNFTDGTVNKSDGKPLVDDLFYYARNHDVWNAHLDADAHYDQYGWREGRDPNAYFSTAAYLSQNPDVQAAGLNPLEHYAHYGWWEGRHAPVGFDPAQYLAANPDVKDAGFEPLAHFLVWGVQEGRWPFAPAVEVTANGFDYVYYLAHNPDVAATGVDPLAHFQTFGWQEGRNPNALFDTAGYLATYTDVAAAGLNPLDHYNQYGWQEGRDPSVGFDTADYLAAYADVAAAQVNPLIHYLVYGQHEGRSAFADGAWG
jgi:hypothetical protein